MLWNGLELPESYFHDDDVYIIKGDACQTLPQLPEKSANLVLTDPPYLREFLYTYDYLADYCPRLMPRGASLITIVGHFAIPEVVAKFQDKLKYRWTFCMNQFDGSHARMAMGIEVLWKPCLWYVKDAYPQGRGFIRDGFIVSGKNGQTKSSSHKWEQDTSWAEFFISKLTNEKSVVLDPFLGSGTTAVASRGLDRKCIGIEISEEYCELATLRYLRSLND